MKVFFQINLKIQTVIARWFASMESAQFATDTNRADERCFQFSTFTLFQKLLIDREGVLATISGVRDFLGNKKLGSSV